MAFNLQTKYERINSMPNQKSPEEKERRKQK